MEKIAKLEGDTPEYDLSHQYIFTENYGKTFVYDIGTWEKVAELDGSFNQFSFDNKFFLLLTTILRMYMILIIVKNYLRWMETLNNIVQMVIMFLLMRTIQLMCIIPVIGQK